MARAYAALREASGGGRTDAFPASEYPAARDYPFVLAICRSGTTTEVVRLLEQLPAESDSLVITAVAGTPAPAAARRRLVLDFADEESVVQTRFATTTLALLRASLGADVAGSPTMRSARWQRRSRSTPDASSRSRSSAPAGPSAWPKRLP